MKISPMFTAALLSVTLTGLAASASAAPVALYTLTGAVVTQKLSVSGCKALPVGGLATATFYKDDVTGDQTYTIVRNAPGVPTQEGSWSVLNSTSSYTINMMPNVYAPSPYDDPETVPAGTLDELLTALQVLGEANCKTNPKYNQSATVTFVQPSVLISKNAMVVKNKDKSAVLSFTMKGKQVNNLKGSTKVGTFSTTITMKGIVTEATPPTSVATLTM